MAKDKTKTRPRIALSKLRHVRTEMAKVYCEARREEMTTRDLTRFVYSLRMLGQVLEAELIERRLDALEKRVQ